MVELLVLLSLSAAAGMRIALPLLVIGLLREGSWSGVPILSYISPPVIIGVLVSWSLFELFASKKLLGQRILQLVQLLCSPIVGTILGIAVADAADATAWLLWIFAIVGGLLALVLQLVQVGWFYRLRGLPLWMILLQDTLCVLLVLLAFDAPRQGGIIAMLLLWLAIRSSSAWRHWYIQQTNPKNYKNPRRYKQMPD